MHLEQIWTTFQSAQLSTTLTPSPPAPDRFDNPFLVNYVAYHHYRSLGWVVKGGIKFCVDFLLYKKGPVFHHAEYVLRLLPRLLKLTSVRFAIVVCPVYEDPADEETCPFDLQNTKPFEWSWLSTINRVNSQVQKVCSLLSFSSICSELTSFLQTLILAYVTIPARSRISPALLSSPACFAHYSVREVVVRRFIPARMRD